MTHTLPTPKTNRSKAQKGRGIGSGHGGHYSGRGGKGQTARTGSKRSRPGFEGGQMPLSRRLPRLRGTSKRSSASSRGFFDSKIRHYQLSLSLIAERLEGDTVDFEALFAAGFVRHLSKPISVKILFDKPITRKLTIKQIPLSAQAREAVVAAGGEVVE